MGLNQHLAMAGIIVTCALTACTTQIVVKPVPATAGAVSDGIIYSLPMLAIKVKATYTLESCAETKKEEQTKVEVKVDAEPVYLPDPGQTYAISYVELEKLTKSTNLKVELHSNGMLKSINADLTDNTGPIIAKTVGQVLKLAMTSVGVGMMEEGAEPPPPAPVPCTKDIARKVRMAKEFYDKISVNTDQVDQINNRLSDLPADHGSVPKLKETRRGLLEAIGKDTKALEKIRKSLSLTQVVTLFPGVKTDKAGRDSAFRKTIELPVTTTSVWFVSQQAPDESKLFLDVRGLDGRVPQLETSTRNAGMEYIIYRQSRPVQVTVCAGQSCWDGNSLIVPDTQQLLTAVYSMPQAGGFGRLEIKNRPFEKNSVVATFSEDGNLGTLSFTTSTEAIEKTQKEIDDTIATYGKYRAGQKGSALDKLKRLTDETKAQKDLVDAQKALIDAQEALEKAKTEPETSTQ